VVFTADANSNPDIKSFMQQINSDLATNRHSTALMTNLIINYQLAISGYSDHASFDYKIVLTPTVTNYILNAGGGTTPTVIDAEWIAWNNNNPVTITTDQYGPLEINYPIDAIKSQLPDVYNVLKGTSAETVLQSPNLIDATGLYSQQPLDKWDSLFDPAYTLSETAGYGYKGQKIAVTTYASGISGAFSGQLKVNNIDEDFTADTKYHISTAERPNAGSINVEGHANPYQVQGGWAFSTTAQAAQNISNTTAGGLSTMTIYAMAGFAAVIAGGVFWWSNRKMKQVVHEVDTGPIEYETRQHWADKFDGEPTGATGTVRQPSKPDEKRSRSAI